MHAQGNNVVGLMDAVGPSRTGDKSKYPPCKGDKYCQYDVGFMAAHKLTLDAWPRDGSPQYYAVVGWHTCGVTPHAM